MQIEVIPIFILGQPKVSVKPASQPILFEGEISHNPCTGTSNPMARFIAARKLDIRRGKVF